MLTICNGLCGMAVIAIATGVAGVGGSSRGLTHGEYLWCVGLLVLGCVFDFTDGMAAARWGSSGRGDALDSMCDTITFGLGPAMMLLAAHATADAGLRALTALAGAWLLAASMLRLSRSHVQQQRARGDHQGLPMPCAASVVAGLLYLKPPAGLELAMICLTGALMVSRVRYPRFSVAHVLPFAIYATAIALGIAGAVPGWPIALAPVLYFPLMPLADRRIRASLGVGRAASGVFGAQAASSRVSPARTRSPTRTAGSTPAGITTSTREPKRISPIRSPWATRSPTRR